MLIFTRKSGQAVMIGHDVEVTVHRKGNQITVYVDAPQAIPVNRKEIYKKKYPEMAKRWKDKKDENDQEGTED